MLLRGRTAKQCSAHSRKGPSYRKGLSSESKFRNPSSAPKADPASLRDAIRSFEKLDGDGYKMVTEGGDGNGRATYEE